MTGWLAEEDTSTFLADSSPVGSWRLGLRLVSVAHPCLSVWVRSFPTLAICGVGVGIGAGDFGVACSPPPSRKL